jgi:Stage II sporulation protein E (SpoIIE)
VSSEPDSTDPQRGDRTESRLPPRLGPRDATADPARMASQVLASLVPGFADAAGIYVLEQLLSDGAPVPPMADAGQQAVVVRRLAAQTATPGQHAFGVAFPSGEAVALAADSSPARSLRDGAPVIFTQPGSSVLQRISIEARSTLSGYASFLAAPMITRATAIGILIMARGAGAPPFRAADTQAAADLAGRAGAAVADSLALMRHRSVTEALLLPQRAVTPLPRGRLEIAGRCLPTMGCEAGGDWYDIIPLPGERTGLMVGDVMGHGPLAATVMTRLSAAAYTLADLDLPPADVIQQLNRTALALPFDTLATCAYAVIDPARQSCDIATAGHLPPVLTMPDATTRVVGVPGGQSLGVAPASYRQTRIRLRPGTILALYTDGLVETRTRPFDQGILALRSALARPHADLDATCDQLATASSETCEDDITLVLARIQPDPEE